MSGTVRAQIIPDAATAARELYRQDERVNAIRLQQERAPDVRRPAAPPAEPTRLPEGESPCFAVSRLTIKGDDQGKFAWLAKAASGLQGDDTPVGRCLGGQGINLVLKRLQNALIERGYITTRIVAEPQDIAGSGDLVLSLVAGRINDIRLTPESKDGTRLWAAIPARPGDILNLRDIEQGLENLRYVPTADADMKLVPGEQPGQSDLVVAHRQARPWRATLAADDGGTKATGKQQGSVTVAYDNLARMNDLLYLTLNHDLAFHGGRGTRGGILHYSLPIGYWNLSATHDRSDYHQTIAGAFQNYTYSGSNGNTELKASRIVHRDGNSKTSIAAGAFQRTAHNYIDDTEVEVQRRKTAGWLARLNHRHFFGAATLDATAGYKRGTGAFGAITAPEEAFGEGTSRFRIATADLTFVTPFAVADRGYRYQLAWRGQWNRTPLAPPERFVIGGRYTVRGFDGETVLSAERGWLIRNEVATAIMPGLEAYAGLDHGQVGGPTASLLLGRRLTGAVLGVRGSVKGLYYDVFIGAPVAKPAGFKTAGTTAGFNLSYGF